jgi:hypothetical protein
MQIMEHQHAARFQKGADFLRETSAEQALGIGALVPIRGFKSML